MRKHVFSCFWLRLSVSSPLVPFTRPKDVWGTQIHQPMISQPLIPPTLHLHLHLHLIHRPITSTPQPFPIHHHPAAFSSNKLISRSTGASAKPISPSPSSTATSPPTTAAGAGPRPSAPTRNPISASSTRFSNPKSLILGASIFGNGCRSYGSLRVRRRFMIRGDGGVRRLLGCWEGRREVIPR